MVSALLAIALLHWILLFLLGANGVFGVRLPRRCQ
jgi:hypothetical protein